MSKKCNEGRFLLALSAILAWAALSHPALAQDIPSRMHILVEDDDDFRRCGLSMDGIEAAGKSAMRFNRIEIVPPSDNLYVLPILYIAINSMEVVRASCVSSIEVTIMQYDTYPKINGEYYSGHFTFCTSGYMLAGPNHASRTYDTIRQQVDECLAKISSSEFGSFMRQFYNSAGDKARAEE